MSACISGHGEYSDHAPGDEEFVCGRCYVVDEEAMRAEIERLRADRPRVGDQITTAEQLDALPVGTVLRTRSGRLAETGYLATDTTPVVWCEGWGDYADAIEHYAPLTVLYVPGEQPGSSTADVEGIVRSIMAMSALTGQDARAVVDAALALAAARPSVTDNARAEEQSGYTVQQTAAHFARSVQRVSDRIQRTDYRRSVVDVVALESVQGFLDRIARDDLGVYADGRAETTTATVEDAARAVAAWALDFAGLGVGIYLNGETIGDPNGPWDVPTDAADSLAAWLNQCGLLATTRTRPEEP